MFYVRAGTNIKILVIPFNLVGLHSERLKGSFFKMARKERNSVDYFPHEVSHGKKMFYLRDKYRNDGYAVWFMLLEQLGKSDYHYLDLKDNIQLMYLSAEFKVSEELLLQIIDTLVKFNEFDSDLWLSEKILYNQKFIDNISDAYKKRNNDCVDINSLRNLLISKGRIKPLKSTPKQQKSNLKGVDNTQTILKNTKVNKNIQERKQEFHNSLIPFLKFYSKEMLKDFFEYWAEHGEKDRKFRKEKEKSFNLDLRLKTWFKRSKQFKEKNVAPKKEKLNAGELIKQKYGFS